MRYGYGVHSPMAFRFIREVLFPGDYAYYAENDLSKKAALAVRVAHFFPIRQIIVEEKEEFRPLLRLFEAFHLPSAGGHLQGPFPSERSYLLFVYPDLNERAFRDYFHACDSTNIICLSDAPKRKSCFRTIIKESAHGVAFHCKSLSVLIQSEAFLPHEYYL